MINCKGKLIDLSIPKIMGIINLTPDSFYDGGKNNHINKALKKTEEYIKQGADFIDIGGCSTRPNATTISLKEELDRILPTLKEIKKNFPHTLISIDTFRSKVAFEAIYHGAHIINDVMGGDFDEAIFQVASQLKVPYILTHSKGIPRENQKEIYNKKEELILEINRFFSHKINILKSYGINDIILDPGFGFGKGPLENFYLIKNLSFIGFNQYPLLIGISRKSTIQKILKCTAENALNGSSILHTLALLNGASILRVHDVKEAKEVILLVKAYQES